MGIGVRIVFALLAFAAAPALAQRIATDGTMGAAQTLGGPNYTIPSSLGTSVVGNLFHSFSRFGVGSGESATFTGSGYSNVVSRVTGGSASSINGTLRSTIAGANFWFINPKGVTFGPNASLDVPASFHVASASYVKLGSTGRFDAVNPGASVLTSAAPSAFGFLGGNGAVRVTGADLIAAPGQQVSLVGGELILSGALVRAVGGRINLASVSSGELSLTPGGMGTSSGSSLATASFANSNVETFGAPSGPIYIRAGQLALSGSTLDSGNAGAAIGGAISVKVDGAMTMSGGAIRSDVLDPGAGDSGAISIGAGSLALSSGALIDTGVHQDNATANGGLLSISAGDVTLASGSRLVTSSDGDGSSGNSGGLAVTAGDFVMTGGSLIDGTTVGNGTGGKFVFNVGNLSLSEGARIEVSTLFDTGGIPGTGRGGDLVVNASGTVDISGPGSGLFSIATGYGDGGTVRVAARDILLSSGAQINASALDQFFLGNDLGQTGSVELRALSSIRLDGASISTVRTLNVTTPSASAGGGDIDIRAGDLFSLRGSRISASVTDNLGGGGDITIDPTFVILQNSQILAQAFGGVGGDISITAQYFITDQASVIDASSQFNRSGSVQITTPNADAAKDLGVLPAAYVDLSALIRESCASRVARGTGNSFVGVGRGALPEAPRALAYSDYGYAKAPAGALAVRLPGCAL